MKVKLLKDLPGNPKGTILELTTDGWLGLYTGGGNRTDFGPNAIKANPEFFEVIKEQRFKVGDWVWDEFSGIARKITAEFLKAFGDANQCKFNILNSNSRYKRLATSEEIKQSTEVEDRVNGLEITINHHEIVFKYRMAAGCYITISELKRIISIAENLQEK